MNNLKASFIVTCVGGGFTIIAALAYILRLNDIAGGLSIAATGISIFLAFYSIAYTYISGQKTLETLNKIELQYRSLVDKINFERTSQNHGDANIESIRLSLEKILKE
ncbi:MAG: hypothetical protein IJ646_12180 [Clostridia bacterium]|nr:hypothetical protein [Clostridia bacterium]